MGFDFDQGALEACFKRSVDEGLAIQTVFLDVANPSPSQGWGQMERLGLRERASGGAVLALAFMHHLVISKNIPFGELLDWLMELAPRGVIEFVPKSDPMVQRLLHLREDIFPDYTWEYWHAHVQRMARILKTKRVSSTGRTLIAYERN